MNKILVRAIQPADEKIVAALLHSRWGDREMVSCGKLLDAAKLPGFILEDDNHIAGLVTLHFDSDECEVVTLDAFVFGKGIGSRLLLEVEKMARSRSCRRLWLITSNDNIEALAFYQKRGFRLVAIHRDSITAARKIKPNIPLVAQNRIPLNDEIELEKVL